MPAEFLVGCSCCEAAEGEAEGEAGRSGNGRGHGAGRGQQGKKSLRRRGGGGGGVCTLDGGCSCCAEQVVQSGGAVYDAHGRHKKSYVFGNPNFECNAACTCGDACGNRVVQRGISKRLEVFKTKHKGWAVRALEPIPQGSFVVEYIGEVITTDEAERRGVEYDKSGFSTLFDLDAVGDAACEFTIDATYRCGVARSSTLLRAQPAPGLCLGRYAQSRAAAHRLLRDARHPAARGAHLRLQVRGQRRRHHALSLRRAQLPGVAVLMGEWLY